jgi:tape measure domain-containing protein
MEVMRKNKAFQYLEGAANKTLGWAKSAAIGIGVAGAAVGATAVAMTTKMASFGESARLAFRFLYGGAAAGNQAFSASVRNATALGQDVEDVTGQFVRLRAAQFSLGESEEVFKLAADMKALTGNAQAAERVVTALTQIKTKPVLQAEELVQQLGDAGVATRLVYAELGKKLNKTTEQIRSMISAGKIGSDLGIAAIKEVVKAEVGEKTLGDFALKQSQSTLGGAIDRLVNAPKLFFLRVAESARPAMANVKESIESVINAIGLLDAGSFANFFAKVISLLPRAIALAKEFSAGFGSGFSEVLEGIGSIDGIAKSQGQLWYDFGRGVAKGFALVFELVQKIGQFVGFLQTPMGKVVGAIGVLALVVPPLVTAWGALVTTFGALTAIAGAIVTAIAVVAPVVGTVLGVIAAAVAAVVAAVGLVPLAIGAAVLAAGYAIYRWRGHIVGFFNGAESWLENVGGQLIEGLINGLLSRWQQLRNTVTSIADSITNTVESALGIASPSKVMRSLGANTVDGFMLGLQDGRRSSRDGGSELAGAGATALAAPAAGRPQRVVQNVSLGGITINVGAGAKMRDVRDAAMAGMRDALSRSGEYSGA